LLSLHVMLEGFLSFAPTFVDAGDAELEIKQVDLLEDADLVLGFSAPFCFSFLEAV
jgi:hypothetical protein